MNEYMAARGWTAIEYIDKASASDLAGRKAWTRLMQDARRRRIDHLLVWKLDRAFRSTRKCLNTLQELEHRGVAFSCLTQDIETRTPTGRLLLTVLAAVAEFERELIRERVKEGMVKARRNGVQVGRPTAANRRGFASRFEAVRHELMAGRISKRQAIRQLGIGFSTLTRLLSDVKAEQVDQGL
jgi:putative DNA-invertase from lambdoid prophage Rac